MNKFFTLHTKVPFLSQSWKTDTFEGLIGAMLLAFILGVLFEYQQVFNQQNEDDDDSSQTKIQRSKNKYSLYLKRGVLHIIRVLTGYLMMLLVMTMNIWLFISVLTGSAIGYFLCRPWTHIRRINNNDKIGGMQGVSQPLLLAEIPGNFQNERVKPIQARLINTTECHGESTL